MPRATNGPRRERVLVLLDATTAHAHDVALANYVDALVRGLDGELVVACQPGDAEHYQRLAPRAAIVVGPVALRWGGVRTAVRVADEVIVLPPAMADDLEHTLTIDARDVLVAPTAADDLERFAAAHRLAYRAAASLVPAKTGPIVLPARDEHGRAINPGTAETPR